MKTMYCGVIHQNAYCHDCGKIWQQQFTARQNAYNHAKKTGHRVTVEIAKAIKYN